jgi:hypothetical protein
LIVAILGFLAFREKLRTGINFASVRAYPTPTPYTRSPLDPNDGAGRDGIEPVPRGW